MSALNGRLLLELTRGATLMLDLNDTNCMLYPEEVQALLRAGQVATINTFTVEEKTGPLVGSPQDEAPGWLIDALTGTLDKLRFVKIAYVAGVYERTETPKQTGFLVALCNDPQYAKRTIHDVITVIQPLCEQQEGPVVDLAHFDPLGDIPACIPNLYLTPFYDRAWGARLVERSNQSNFSGS